MNEMKQFPAIYCKCRFVSVNRHIKTQKMFHQVLQVNLQDLAYLFSQDSHFLNGITSSDGEFFC